MWKDYDKNKDQFYEEILTRAKNNLPELKISDNRFIIPDLDSEVQGNRTFLRNFRHISNIINRPDAHFLKYLKTLK